MLDYTYLHECFAYDGLTGQLTWKARPLHHFKSKRAMSIANSKCLGKVAGCEYFKHTKKYVKIGISGRDYQAHHVALKMNKVDIKSGLVVDHIDGDGTNNRLENIRVVTVSDNCRNQRLRSSNKSGYVGVNIHKQTGKWRAYIYDGKKQVSLGLHDSIEKAVEARLVASKSLKYHNNHGSIRPL